jgi:hypothetical protein
MEFAPDKYYLVGFEGKQYKAPLTYGAAAIVHNGRFYNAVLGQGSARPMSEWKEERVSVEVIGPFEVPEDVAKSETMVLSVTTTGAIGAFFFNLFDAAGIGPERRYHDGRRTYVPFPSFDDLNRFIKPASKKLVEWRELPGIAPTDREFATTAAHILDSDLAHREILGDLYEENPA